MSPTLCDPIDSSPPGSPVPGILQARTLEWVAIAFYNAWKWKVKVKSLSRVRLLATPWTAAYQAPPSTGFSRQEYWSGVPLPSPIKLLRTFKYKFSWISVSFLFYFSGSPYFPWPCQKLLLILTTFSPIGFLHTPSFCLQIKRTLPLSFQSVCLVFFSLNCTG